jgi:hypothetical protein
MDIKDEINKFITENNINNPILIEALNKEDYKQVEESLQEYFDTEYSYLTPDNYKKLTGILSVLDATNYKNELRATAITIEDLLEEETYNEYEEF